jgi:hypothetical protein
MADLIYASIFWALLAWAGHFLIGPIEGVALWRIFAITGIAGFIHGYLTRISRGVAGRLELNRELEELTAIARGDESPAGEEPPAGEELETCIIGGCDHAATVGVAWAGESELIFRFCAEHDPRRIESAS